MKMTDTIKDIQLALGLDPNGLGTLETWQSIHRQLVPQASRTGRRGRGATSRAPQAEIVDERSEKNIATLEEAVRPYARALVEKAKALGITIKVISGTRTYAEQDALYAKGRTTPGPKVTNARGGYSNHNFGIAFDIGVFVGTSYKGESPQYKAVGVIGTELGLEWGGNWTSIVDEPHFQLRPAWAKGLKEREMLAVLRQRKNDGRPVFD